MPYVYVKESCAVSWKGSVVRLRRGAAWDKNDPFVKDKPEFFASQPTIVHRSRAERPVEDATAVPGKKRNIT